MKSGLIKRVAWAVFALGMASALCPGQDRQLPALKVSDNHRYLVDAEGKPFFYLADTAWELFHRLKHEEATDYLKDRADKHFNVIQGVVLAEFNGLTAPNA